MTPELKQRWTAALLSGKYTQAKQVFYLEEAWPEEGPPIEKHCCLAVLCDIAAPEGWGKEPPPPEDEEDIPDMGEHMWEYDGQLTRQGLKALGLTDTNQMKLVSLNDTSPEPNFPEIAQWIEEHL